MVEHRRIATTLDYADADEARNAAFVGGPVALAWSRCDPGTWTRVRSSYLDAIEAWRYGQGYRVPAEFLVHTAVASTVARADSSRV